MAGKIREEGLDKFYTKVEIAKECIDKLTTFYDWKRWDLIIEPSAGNGSFYNEIPTTNKVGIDICPEGDKIVKGDFFTYQPPPNKKNILVIGNPPFGKVSSLAVQFFNHASRFSDVIAFIIPRTFRRVSIQNKLNMNFHLKFDMELPIKPCCFDPPMAVKCCFQIWERKETPRMKTILKTTHTDWDFLPFGPKDEKNQPTPPKNADFAIRAYGGKIGEIVIDRLDTLRPKSWHWIKSNIHKDILLERFSKLDYSESKNTARQNSLGKGELVSLYSACKF